MLSIEGNVAKRCQSIFVRTSRLSREKLIYKGTKLGITVEPEEVRLIPTADDSYAWRIVPEKEHLFKREILKKHLSKHSIGVYRHLYRAVGDSLEAIPATELQSTAKEAQIRIAEVGALFDI